MQEQRDFRSRASSDRVRPLTQGQVSLLVRLVQLVDRLPPVPPPPKRGPGRPKVYTDHLFLKALVIMIVRHLHTVHELLTILEQSTPEMQRLRVLLTEN